MDHSTPGFPVLRHLPEFAQTHVHWVNDAIQPWVIISTQREEAQWTLGRSGRWAGSLQAKIPTRPASARLVQNLGSHTLRRSPASKAIAPGATPSLILFGSKVKLRCTVYDHKIRKYRYELPFFSENFILLILPLHSLWSNMIKCLSWYSC